MKLFNISYDNVISGIYATGVASYNYALGNIYPLIDRLPFQRKLQDKKFYEKLERDIIDGCIMPPITIAFVNTDINFDNIRISELEEYVNQEIKNSFVLDGIQRLNTLKRASQNLNFNKESNIYINIILCSSEDKLLYRMITLNNGQRPMTPRHQVEVMMANLMDFKKFNIEVQSEKERAKKIKRGSFNESDLIQAYLAFMANSPIVDNKKIIEDKMDLLLVGKIISNEPTKYKIAFSEILNELSRMVQNDYLSKWIRITNNLVGFVVGAKESLSYISKDTIEEIEESVRLFEDGFASLNPSKIKLGRYRRELSAAFFKEYKTVKKYDYTELLEFFLGKIDD